MNSLGHDFVILSKGFHNNFIVLKPDECSFMLLDVDDELLTNLVEKMKLVKTVNKKKY